MNSIKALCCLVILIPLLSCSESQKPLKNDNPDKYTIARDLLWASPGGFDLTMDIYTPTSGKVSYPGAGDVSWWRMVD